VFALPSRSDQETIVHALLIAESSRACAEAVVRAARSLKEAIVDDAIWDTKTNSWRVPLHRVGELLDEKPRNGLSPRPTGGEASIRSVTLSAVRNGDFIADASTEKRVEADERAEDFLVREGDVFAVRGNGNRDLVGRVGHARHTPEPPCIYPDLLIRLRFERSQIEPLLATEIWNSTRVHEALLTRAKSTNGIYKVNGKDISAHEIPVPAPDVAAVVLGKLDSAARVVDAATHHAEDSLAVARALRERLLSGTDRDV
jgi:type I restriction enzyme S subunit